MIQWVTNVLVFVNLLFFDNFRQKRRDQSQTRSCFRKYAYSPWSFTDSPSILSGLLVVWMEWRCSSGKSKTINTSEILTSNQTHSGRAVTSNVWTAPWKATQPSCGLWYWTWSGCLLLRLPHGLSGQIRSRILMQVKMAFLPRHATQYSSAGSS